MKKTLFLGALVALAMTFVSCINGLKADPEAFTIKYGAGKQYAAPEVTVASNWKTIEFEFDADADTLAKLQFAVTTDKEAGPASWDPNTMTYVTSYVPVTDAKMTINFADLLVANEKDDAGNDKADTSAKAKGATKYTKIALQILTAEEEDLSLKVKGAIVTKNDNFQEAVVLNGDWGSTVTKD